MGRREIEDIPTYYKEVLKLSIRVVLSDLERSLCYVGGRAVLSDLEKSLCYVGGEPMESSCSYLGTQGIKDRSIPSVVASHCGATNAFIGLFQEYPESIDFFPAFHGNSIEEIQSNFSLSETLHDHAITIIRGLKLLVECFIVNMETSIEKVCMISK